MVIELTGFPVRLYIWGAYYQSGYKVLVLILRELFRWVPFLGFIEIFEGFLFLSPSLNVGKIRILGLILRFLWGVYVWGWIYTQICTEQGK